MFSKADRNLLLRKNNFTAEKGVNGVYAERRIFTAEKGVKRVYAEIVFPPRNLCFLCSHRLRFSFFTAEKGVNGVCAEFSFSVQLCFSCSPRLRFFSPDQSEIQIHKRPLKN